MPVWHIDIGKWVCGRVYPPVLFLWKVVFWNITRVWLACHVWHILWFCVFFALFVILVSFWCHLVVWHILILLLFDCFGIILGDVTCVPNLCRTRAQTVYPTCHMAFTSVLSVFGSYFGSYFGSKPLSGIRTWQLCILCPIQYYCVAHLEDAVCGHFGYARAQMSHACPNLVCTRFVVLLFFTFYVILAFCLALCGIL